MRPPDEAQVPRLGRLVWWGGTIILAAVAVAAGTQLAAMLADTWHDFPGEPGSVGLIAMAAGLGVALLATLLAVNGSPIAAHFLGWMPWTGLAVLVALRVVAMLLFDAPNSSDPRFVRDLAVAAAAGEQGPFAHRPMGYSLILAVPYALFGSEVWVAEGTNLVLSALTGVALFGFTRAAFGAIAAGLALTFYAVSPAQVLLTLPTLSEITYAGLLLGAGWAALSRRMDLAGAAVVGLLVGLSQWVRPLSQVLLLAFAALPFVIGLPLRRAGMYAIAAAIFFAVAVGPVIIHNYTSYGDLSASSSAYGGWSLFVGANQAADGKYNPEDGEVLAAQPGRSWWERSRAIGALGMRRITADPVGFAGLAVRKFWVLWAEERYGVIWSVRGGEAGPRVAATLVVVSQAAWVLTVFGALATLVTQRRRPQAGTLLICMLLVLVAGMHVFVEVQSRYHAYVVPFLIALAAAWVSGRPWARRLQDARKASH